MGTAKTISRESMAVESSNADSLPNHHMRCSPTHQQQHHLNQNSQPQQSLVEAEVSESMQFEDQEDDGVVLVDPQPIKTPKNWMPQVKDEARRQLEWEVNRRMQMAKTPLEQIAPSRQEVNTSFNRDKPKKSSELPAYIEKFEAHLESAKAAAAVSCKSKSAHRWATMVVDNYILPQKIKSAQQNLFNKAITVLLGFQKKN